jgi:RNA polymerase sigma-70 factor (ECF subfamily)
MTMSSPRPSHAADTIAGPADCLRRLAVGADASAWAWLSLNLGEPMRAMAYRLTGDPSLADDAVQEAILAMRRHAGAFAARAIQGDPPDDQARRWILRVAANAARVVRRAEIRAQRRGRGADRPQPQPIGPAAGLERSDAAALVRDALDALPERERSAVLLHIVGELGYDQVAHELRCPLGSAKTWVHRGLMRLRRRLHRNQDSALAVAALQLPPPAAKAVSLRAAGSASSSLGAAIIPISLHGTSMAALIAIPIACACVLGAGFGIHALAGDAPTGPPPSTPSAAPAAQAQQPSRPDYDMEPTRQQLAKMELRLRARTRVDFDHAPLSDAVDLLRQATRQNLILDPTAAFAAGEITLHARSMSLRASSEWCAALAGARLWFMSNIDGPDALMFSHADQGVLTADLDHPVHLLLAHAHWQDVVDSLRFQQLAIIDAAPASAATWVMDIDERGTARAVLDRLAKAKGMTWIGAGGWIVLGSGPIGRTDPAIAAGMRKVIDSSSMSIDYHRTPLSEVAADLSRQLSIPVILDPGLRPMPVLSVQAHHVSAWHILHSIAEISGMRLALRSEALVLAKCPSALLPIVAPTGLDDPPTTKAAEPHEVQGATQGPSGNF